MPYERVWIPELNQWKIIGEDTGEYAEIYKAYPGATGINITASTGQILVTTPTGMEIVGALETVGQIEKLSQPYRITTYDPTFDRTETPGVSVPVASGIKGFGIIGVLAIAFLAFSKRRK